MSVKSSHNNRYSKKVQIVHRSCCTDVHRNILEGRNHKWVSKSGKIPRAQNLKIFKTLSTLWQIITFGICFCFISADFSSSTSYTFVGKQRLEPAPPSLHLHAPSAKSLTDSLFPFVFVLPLFAFEQGNLLSSKTDELSDAH